MNGRIYDQNIGRFISADPFVQFPHSTQGYNRYTYVGNNPLSFTDPSGYFAKKLLADIVRLVGTVVSAVYCQGAYSACMTAVGAVAGYLEGGKHGAFRGAVSSGMAAGTSTMIGKAFGAKFGDNIGYDQPGALFGKAMAHGIAQGALSSAGGGRFGDGFLSAFASAMASPLIEEVAPGDFSAKGKAMRITVAAIIGGTASEIGGGSFANGAVTGAMVWAFNGETMYEEKASDPVICPANGTCEVWIDRASGDFGLGIGGGKIFIYDPYSKNVHEFDFIEGSVGPGVGAFESGELGIVEPIDDALTISEFTGFGLGVDGGLQIASAGILFGGSSNFSLGYYFIHHNMMPAASSSGLFAGGGLALSYTTYVRSYTVSEAHVTQKNAFCRAGC